MLAKIKHDEDVFKRPLDENSLWYKLSREKVDYRQISFDKMNRDFPELKEQLDAIPPQFAFDNRTPPGTSGWFFNPKKRFANEPLTLANVGSYRVWDRNPITNMPWSQDDEYKLIYNYVFRINTYNFWWFDLCLIPQLYSTFFNAGVNLSMGPYESDRFKNRIWDDISPFLYYSPSRDLATSVFLQFASMQNDPQYFIRKTSHITAPYMEFVEEQVGWNFPLSRTSFNLDDPNDYVGILPTIYGIGDSPRSKDPDVGDWLSSIDGLFTGQNKSVVDRLNRQKMFNDFFKALDSADWLGADKLADKLIYLSDPTGWGPYIGYGDLSLFIQRMGIPSEYIMTHGLTDAQDELLTNAYGLVQLNNKVIDLAHDIQSKDPSFNNSISQNYNTYTDLGLYNSYLDDLMRTSTEVTVKIQDAIGQYLMTNGSIDDAKTILSNAPTISDGIDILESRSVSIAIDKEIENLKKAKR